MKDIGVRAHNGHNPLGLFGSSPQNQYLMCEMVFHRGGLALDHGAEKCFSIKDMQSKCSPSDEHVWPHNANKSLGKVLRKWHQGHDACLLVNHGRHEVNDAGGKYHWEQHICIVWGQTCTHLCRPKHFPLIYRTLQNVLPSS